MVTVRQKQIGLVRVLQVFVYQAEELEWSLILRPFLAFLLVGMELNYLLKNETTGINIWEMDVVQIALLNKNSVVKEETSLCQTSEFHAKITLTLYVEMAYQRQEKHEMMEMFKDWMDVALIVRLKQASNAMSNQQPITASVSPFAEMEWLLEMRNVMMATQ